MKSPGVADPEPYTELSARRSQRAASGWKPDETAWSRSAVETAEGNAVLPFFHPVSNALSCPEGSGERGLPAGVARLPALCHCYKLVCPHLCIRLRA